MNEKQTKNQTKKLKKPCGINQTRCIMPVSIYFDNKNNKQLIKVLKRAFDILIRKEKEGKTFPFFLFSTWKDAYWEKTREKENG